MNLRSLSAFAVAFGMTALAGAAAAGTPSPEWSTWPRHVNLVGRNAVGTSDPIGTLDFHITRYGGTVEEAWLIAFDFANAPDIDLCLEQDPGVSVYCANGQRWVTVQCDNHGRASFRIIGRAHHAGPGSNAPSLALYADGVPFGTMPVGAYDQDGNGVGPADQSLWLQDYFSGQYWQRSDFDGDGTISPSDLSLWRQAFFDAGSIQNCAGATCP